MVVPYCNARSRSTPDMTAFTGMPPVTIDTNSSTAPKPFTSPKVSLYVCRIYRGCYQGSSYRSCYVSNDSAVISHHGSANVCQLIKDIFSILCVEVIFLEFLFFCVPFLYHAFCSVSTERHTIRKP